MRENPAMEWSQELRKRAARLAACAAVALALAIGLPRAALAELLYLQPPFDEIMLDANNQGAILRVQPLGFPGGKLPRESDRVGDLEFELLDRPGEKYAVPWLNIVGVRFFPELVLAEASGLVAERRYDEAQPYFQFLEARHPQTPGLGEAIESFLYQQIGLAYSAKRYGEALAMLVVLHGRNPGRPGVATAYQRVTLELVKEHLAENNYAAARGLLRSLAAKYPAAEAPAVAPVEAQLQAQAAGLVARAKAARAAGRLSEAMATIREAVEVWPAVPEGNELAAAIFAEHPAVSVAVRVPLAGPPQDRPGDWAADRTWPLVRQGLARADEPNAASPASITRFNRPPPASAAVAEVAEYAFPDAGEAFRALRRGDVSIVDRLRGAEIPAKLPPEIAIRPYARPTVHLLVPNPRRPIADSRTLRRAVLYGLDREGTLRRSFLGDRDSPGYAVISGPLPRGAAGDVWAAAYDASIPPVAYQPQTALLLARLATEELTGDDRASAASGLARLTIAHPRDPQITAACQAIARQLRTIGLDVALAVEPAAGDDYDLRYTELTMRDPASGLRSLLGPAGIAECTSPALLAAVASALEASTPQEQAERLQQVHQRAAAELPVIPLWQLTDHFAVHSSIQGISEQPAELYERLDAWQVAPRTSGP